MCSKIFSSLVANDEYFLFSKSSSVKFEALSFTFSVSVSLSPSPKGPFCLSKSSTYTQSSSSHRKIFAFFFSELFFSKDDGMVESEHRSEYFLSLRKPRDSCCFEPRKERVAKVGIWGSSRAQLSSLRASFDRWGGGLRLKSRRVEGRRVGLSSNLNLRTMSIGTFKYWFWSTAFLFLICYSFM